MRISISDMIYVLDIQNKNRHIDSVLKKYGADIASVDAMKDALKSGRWAVVG